MRHQAPGVMICDCRLVGCAEHLVRHSTLVAAFLRLELRVEIVGGNPGVFQGYPYPYPSQPLPPVVGYGFCSGLRSLTPTPTLAYPSYILQGFLPMTIFVSNNIYDSSNY